MVNLFACEGIALVDFATISRCAQQLLLKIRSEIGKHSVTFGMPGIEETPGGRSQLTISNSPKLCFVHKCDTKSRTRHPCHISEGASLCFKLSSNSRMSFGGRRWLPVLWPRRGHYSQTIPRRLEEGGVIITAQRIKMNEVRPEQRTHRIQAVLQNLILFVWPKPPHH